MSDPSPRSRPTTTRVQSTRGVTLSVHDLGGTGRPVLAAHATGFNALTWGPLAAALPAAHVVAPDFRAHGGSRTEPGADLAWHLFGDDVLATLDASGWSGPSRGSHRPVGIGHSMGGAALLLAEQQRPGSFAALWLYEPIIFPPEVRAGLGAGQNPLAAGALRRRPTFASRDEAVRNYGSKPPMDSFTPEALEGYVTGGFVDGADGTVRLACRPEDESRTFEGAAGCDAFEHLDQVDCPVMVVRGVLEDLSPAAIAGPAADALPRGRLSVHDELSHFGPMEDPVGLAAEIDRFMNGL